MLRSRKFWATVGVVLLLWALANPVSAANGINGLLDGGNKAGDSLTTIVEGVGNGQ